MSCLGAGTHTSARWRQIQVAWWLQIDARGATVTAMKPTAFREKLGLVLKTLVLSRTGLAAALNVDKSLVGRWAAGAVIPSEHNLVHLTRFIGTRVEGFTLLDWERDVSDFARVLTAGHVGESREKAAAVAVPDFIPPAIFEEGRRGAELRGAAYEGYWMSLRASSDLPGRFLRDITMIRRRPDGLIGFTTGIERERYYGWALLLQHQLFSIGWDEPHGTLMFGIFNGVARQRAEVLDGLQIATLRDAGSSPACSACVMFRIADLSGDEEKDGAFFTDKVEALDPIVPPEEVPADVRRRLAETTSDTAPGLMRMFFSTSLARGPVLDGGGLR